VLIISQKCPCTGCGKGPSSDPAGSLEAGFAAGGERKGEGR